VPLNAALLAQRLPINDVEALLCDQFGSDLDQALRAGRLAMKKADKHLKEWTVNNRRGAYAAGSN
jgi:hypothetical protein